ncbi:MAG: alpha/beta fold hydrolase [Candidatus Acidiferrales bacterium]|jgi:dienelactone hydrolase
MKICALALTLFLAILAVAAQQSDTESPGVTAGRQVVEEIVAGQFSQVEAQYDAQMMAGLPPGKLAAGWATLLEQAGSFDSIVAATSSRFQTYDITVIQCKFQNGVIDVQIAFNQEARISGLSFHVHKELAEWTSPGYAKPDSFAEQPLVLVNGNYELPGTLTMPKGGGRFPAVVLLQGSGPHDQDETIGPNKPFEDLAWGLASRGIAVFRYTKRTQKYGAQSSDDPAKMTVEDETMSDARAAIALVAKQPKIDSRRVFLAGHSLGAYLAPRIAAKDARIAGVVMLAANTRPIEQLLVDQMHLAVGAGGAPTPDEQKQLAAVEDAVKKIESPDLKPGESVTLLGGSIPASYWLDLRGYQPTAVAKELKIPILILQGGRDFQVPPATNFEEWKAALGGQRNATLKLYPGLNHLFIAGTGPSLPSEYDKPGHVDEQVIADIALWLSAGGKPAK